MGTGKELTTFNSYLQSEKFIIHATYTEVIGQPSEEECFDALDKLSRVGGSIHWNIGDIANIYVGLYGSMVRLARHVGHVVGTIYVDKFVAAQYEPLWRHKHLSFEHHKIAASWQDREYWLKKAEQNNWSISQMKATRDKERPAPSRRFNEFRKAASELLNIGDDLLQEYKKARTPFREDFEELIEQLLHEVEGLQFEVSITKYRYPLEPLTRKDFKLDEESGHD